MTRVLGSQELSKRVAREATRTGVAPDRLRKWIASTALLELFNVAFAEGRITDFCVKGGFAVELRHPSLARASQDIDIVVTGNLSDRALLEAVITQPWTLFSFSIKDEERRNHATRLIVQAFYHNANWTTIKLDIVREPFDATETIEAHDLTVYGLAGTSPVPCLSRNEQIAQYIHAISLPPADGKRQNRARNIVDIYLFDRYVGCDDSGVLAATEQLFHRRNTHGFPPVIDIPEAWQVELSAIAVELDLDLDGPGLVRYFTVFTARILGVPVSMNYEYHFMVLSAEPRVPPIMEGALKGDPALEAFHRMTKTEGWKLVQLLRYPSQQVTLAMLAVLERPIKEGTP